MIIKKNEPLDSGTEARVVTLPDKLCDRYRDKADVLSLRLYHASNLAKLLAFASETRRHLVEMDELLTLSPEVERRLSRNLKTPGAWKSMEDVSALMLEFLADELASLNSEVSSSMYCLAKGEDVPLQAEATT